MLHNAKRWLTACAAVMALGASLTCSAQQPAKPAKAPKDWAKIEKYAAANDSVRHARNNGRRVVFIGNSITELWKRNYPRFWNEHPDYVCRGISGQTSYQFLVRFRQDVIDLNPAVVVINAGTNDVAENTNPYSEDRTVANIATMAELARLHGIKVILTSVLPASHFSWRPAITDAAPKIASLNKRIKALAKSMNCGYVDYYSNLVSGTECSLNPAMTTDGVHPTEAGYDVMAPLIVQAITKALGKK